MAVIRKYLRIADNTSMTGYREIAESGTANQFNVSNLTPDTQYYIDANVENNRGTARSAQSNFKTDLRLISSPLRVVNNVAGSAITVTLTRNGSPADIDIEYSTDNVNWNTWTETNGVRSMTIAQNGNLYLRGDNPNGLNPTISALDCYTFTADKKYAMAGDIRSLISHYEIDTLPNGAFYRFFLGSTTLDNVSYVRFEAKTLGKSAYSRLFRNCTGLKLSPHILPATTAGERAYYEMFSGCSALQVAPIISATSFGEHTCDSMFYGCSALTQQWATSTVTDSTKTNISFTIASSNDYSFHYMFYNCTSLVNAGGITATQTTNWSPFVCFCMFSGCTKLTTAPSITFGSFVSGAAHCGSMFAGCTSLPSTPNIKLNATTLYGGTYSGMYGGCTKLTTSPEIKATTIGTDSLDSMFHNCTSLTYIKVHFTTWNSDSTTKWTYGTPASGDFYKPSALPSTKNASGNITHADYIPYDWKITNI